MVLILYLVALHLQEAAVAVLLRLVQQAVQVVVVVLLDLLVHLRQEVRVQQDRAIMVELLITLAAVMLAEAEAAVLVLLALMQLL
jgi:hypothetical protein